ncbi:hypothetical protein Plhal703r1_c37g0134171 [Plasmopara halstedii]
MNLPTLLIAAASITTLGNAAFTVTSGTTMATNSSTENVNFVKQWTLNSANAGDAISSIDLELAGRVYISYVRGIPSGILGYVNVSGDTQSIVEAITVGNDDSNDNDQDAENDRDGELNVRLGNISTTNLNGYVLAEIILASSGIVTDVKSHRSGQIVVMDGVLVSTSTTAELQVEASGSSAVYVSATSTALSVRQLQLDAAGTAILQFNVESVTATDEVKVDAQESAGVSVLTGMVRTATLELETQSTSSICINAQNVTASNYEGRDASRISMPNATSRYTSTGSFACDESLVPTREPGCVGSTCGNSTTPGAMANSAGNTPTTTDDDNASEDTNASSSKYLAALSIAMIGIATVVML